MTAFAQEIDFFRCRNAYLENNVGLTPKLCSAFNNCGTGSAISVVTEIGCISGTGLNRNRKTQLDELFNNIRHTGNALFAYARFRGNPYTHEASPLDHF